MPDVYTHGHHRSVTNSHGLRRVEDSAAYVLAHLVDGMSILDVGCGPGSITVDLAERFPGSHVVGIDASAEVIAQATALAHERGVTNVSFRVEDAYALSFADATFDVVHAHQVLQHLTRPVDALRDMRRVMSADGIVAVRDVDYESISWFPQLPELDQWLELYLRIARHNGGEPAAARRLRSWVNEAGFTDPQITGSVWTYASPDEVERWGTTWEARTTQSSFGAQALQYGLATADDLQRIAEGWRRFAHAPDGWFQMSHGEVIARG